MDRCYHVLCQRQNGILTRVLKQEKQKVRPSSASVNKNDCEDKPMNNTLYFPARIMDKKWAQQFVNGQIFMRSLTDFGSWEYRKRSNNSELNNTYRGDFLEGATKFVKTADEDPFFAAFPDDWKKHFINGTLIDTGEIQFFNVLCLSCVEYIPEIGFLRPSDKMKEFGDTAIIIKDMNSFLQRIIEAVNQTIKPAVILMDRVEYYTTNETKPLNPLFNKSVFYREQKELRIAIGRLNAQTETADHSYGLYRSTAPLILQVDSLKAITQMVPINDFCLLKGIEMPIFPMCDIRTNLFNQLIADTRKKMDEYVSRQQMPLFIFG